MENLRDFNECHIEDDCQDMSGVHDNGLFYKCNFRNLKGLTLKDCVLDRSVFQTDKIEEALDFTLTLNCHSFQDVEYSSLLLDLFLTLATMTSGNDDKREKLKDVIGRKRWEALMRVLRSTE